MSAWTGAPDGGHGQSAGEARRLAGEDGRLAAVSEHEGGASERRARVTLSFLASPGDPVLGAALRSMSAAGLLAATTGADNDGQAVLSAVPEAPALARAIERWRARLPDMPSASRLAAWQDAGLRLVLPGDPEWPTQLDDLGDARPLLL